MQGWIEAASGDLSEEAVEIARGAISEYLDVEKEKLRPTDNFSEDYDEPCGFWDLDPDRTHDVLIGTMDYLEDYLGVTMDINDDVSTALDLALVVEIELKHRTK